MRKNTVQSQRNSKVKVGYQEINIIIEKASFSKPSDSYGEFDHRKNVISIQEDLSDRDYACTLLHEVLHAIVYYYSLTQTGQPLDTESKEETTINSITNGLMALFKDNPNILKEFQHRIHNVR